jgi:AcrR family transcriptional regulator
MKAIMPARSTTTASVRPERAPRAAPVGSGRAANEAAAKPRNARDVRSAARREAILSAALDEFSAKGFAAARLDDVAKRAGVAKGTIYLYFADKETLFQELVRSMLTPVIGQFEALATVDIPFPRLAERLVFPAIAEFYYREVLSRVFAALQQILQRAFERGEIRHRGLVAFPQLLAAPVLLGIVWSSLFDKQAPLDMRAMLNAHLDILFDRDGGRS